MLRNTKLLVNTFYSSPFTKILRHLTTNMDPIIAEQPHISEEKEKSLKRACSDDVVNENVKQLKTDDFERIKRKNFVLLMGYLGINYYGMQRNRGMNTIEEELFKALLKADLITQSAFDTMQTIRFQRAARTDKFVSAVRQIVNLKLPEDPSKELVNKYLPEDIRIFGIKKVTKRFNCKNMCDARTYSYTIPTFAFATEEVKYTCIKNIEHEQRMEDLAIINGKHCYEYRITPEKLEQLSRLLKKYEGSHNFHNFTSKIKPLDPRARRYILSFTCSEPFISNDVEFVTLEVKGQSFMMHQIRKMIGTVIGILRENTTEDIFDRCFNEPKLDIPRAPGLGLVLKEVHMDYYNRKYGKDGIHESLDWSDCEEEINTFFKNAIVKHIVETEIKTKNMISWLANMPHHNFDIRNQINESRKDSEEEEDEQEEAEENLKDDAKRDSI